MAIGIIWRQKGNTVEPQAGIFVVRSVPELVQTYTKTPISVHKHTHANKFAHFFGHTHREARAGIYVVRPVALGLEGARDFLGPFKELQATYGERKQLMSTVEEDVSMKQAERAEGRDTHIPVPSNDCLLSTRAPSCSTSGSRTAEL
eukprot:334054-Pelagomonas_calceolata.AAC.1